MTKKEKTTLKEAAEELTAMALKSLSKLPEEEQEARVAAFARRDFSGGGAAGAKLSTRGGIRASRASSRGR
ncbi:MAG TPA: hypothetical protein VMD78_11665 [Candidatus Baltobacteraceae bacterium]|nr:hypothetical protein [Candidatus Baltobacteraceae bacterium]